jgi:hypothetical protein
MDRHERWSEDGDGRRARRGNDPAYRWEGMTLRPTGMVVFATLDRPEPERAAPTAPARSGLARPNLTAAGRLLTTGTGSRSRVSPRDWRRLASRSAAWLLGR